MDDELVLELRTDAPAGCAGGACFNYVRIYFEVAEGTTSAFQWSAVATVPRKYTFINLAPGDDIRHSPFSAAEPYTRSVRDITTIGRSATLIESEIGEDSLTFEY